jgi:beta-mannosidase
MHKLDLCGQWQVHKADCDQTFPALVPGCIHTDLLSAGKIEDPFYRDNEDRLQWIGEADWVYSRTFDVPAEVLASDRVLLHCDGLDTLATVTINGKTVGATDNMFRVWEFDAKDALVVGENTIEVRFASPIPVIQARQAERKLPGWGGPKEIPGRAWVRKEPCSLGWDWGPTLATCGIWRPISLVVLDEARLTDVAIRQEHGADGSVTLSVALGAEAIGGASPVAQVTVSFDGGVVAEATAALESGSAGIALPIPDPQLWWPVNMGAQPLYEVRVELRDQAGKLFDTWARRVGLRTLRLDRHPDQWGESFQFVVNGVPFFAKGANWIPADSFVTRLTDANYRDLLESTAGANMNMLRVWGGGIYEQDIFYDLCDELGITIWQDFMFACSTYPTFDDAFMATVKAEAEDNVRRLRHHACIAFWNGNNELEQGLVGDEWNDWQMSWEDYGKLFDKLIPEVIQALDPDRDYWPSSPHTPCGDRRDFNNPDCGDAHLWDVWHGRKPFEWYRTCTHRFNSEFGFQSFPEPQTVRGYTAPQDRNVTTYVMEHHQRSGIGNAVIMQYMLDWFRLPTEFDMTLWLSQILQGMAMKYACEHWRRAMPRGMGTLYWQLNDCWPVASWASIDYHGRWKALHFMARKFNNPLLVSGVEDWETGSVELHVTSDLLQSCGGEVNWWLVKPDGTEVADGTVAVTAPAGANTLVETLQLGERLKAHGNRDLILGMELAVDGKAVSSNLVTFARPKHLELLDPEFALSIVEGDGGDFAVTVSAAKPALWAWLEVPGTEVRFSDNFVHLFPGKPMTITIKPLEPLTREELVAKVRVRSLVDTYGGCG